MKKFAKIIIIQFIIATMSVCLGALFFLQIEIEPDLSSSIISAYQAEQYRGQTFQWNSIESYNLWSLATMISYKVFGLSEAAVKGMVTICYIVANFLTLQLCVGDKDKNSLFLLPLIFFMMMPGVATNKYHYLSIMVSLLVLVYLKYRRRIQESHRKRVDVCAVILFILLCRVTPDILLIILYIFIPVILYYIWKLLINERYSKYVLLAAAALMPFFVILYVLDGLGMMSWLNHIYGASSSYLAWANLPEIWKNGIDFLLTTVVRAMNIDVSGALVQPVSFAWIIRIALLVIAYADLFYHTRMIIKKREDNLYWIILCGAVILSHIMQLLNGWRILLYENYGYYYSYCGYMGITWFLLVVLAMDFLKRHFALQDVRCLRIFYVTAGITCSAVFMAMAMKFYISDYHSINEEIAEYLLDQGREAGLVTDAAADDLTVWSGGDFYAASTAYLNATNEWKWGYRKFDTYIESTHCMDSEQIAILDQSIEAVYGEAVEKEYFNEGERKAVSDLADDKVLYIFDRDIRWPIQNVDATMLTDETCDIFLPLGESRIVLHGNGLEESELLFEVPDHGDINVECVETGSERLVYQVISPQDMSVTMKLNQGSGTADAICENVEVSMMHAAVCLHEYEEIQRNGTAELAAKIPKGTYNVIVNGKNLDDIELTCPSGDVQIKTLENGSARKIYTCIIGDDKPDIKIVNHGSKTVYLSNVYYESTIEEREMIIEKLRED